GTVVDEIGEPAIGVEVRALRRVFASGRARYQASGATGTTDDRGTFRMPSLQPGDYIVVVPSTSASIPAAYFAQGLPNSSEFSGVIRELSPLGSRRNQQIGDSVL